MNKYNTFIIKLLGDNKIKTSSEICLLLEDKFKVTNDNARKIIQRAVRSGTIASSKPLTLGRGQFAYSLPDLIYTKDRIKSLCEKYRPALYRLLESIDINNGIISYYEALKITASKLTKDTTKVDFLEDLISLLEKLQIVYENVDENRVKYIILKARREDEEELMNAHFDKMYIDTVLLKDIIDWITKSNLIDNSKCVYRNLNIPSKGAKHNNLIWDAFAYTKTTGINPSLAKDSNTPEKQTLVVLDVLINRSYEQVDLDGFLARVQINLKSVSKGRRKILPIVVYKNCSKLILNKIKKLGFLSYDIGSIYGSNIFQVLDKVLELQNNKKLLDKITHKTLAESNFEEIIEDTLNVIDKSGHEDQLKAIKGTLFEIIMYQILKHIYPNAEINHSYVFRKNYVDKKDGRTITEGYEYDYVIRSSNPKEIIIVELKGYKSTYAIGLGDYKTKYTTNWFFKRTLPFIRKNFESQLDNGYRFRGCYIASCEYTPEAIVDLNKLNSGNLKPSSLDVYYDRRKLLALLSEYDFDNLEKIIKRFY